MAEGAAGDLSWPVTRAADMFASSLAVSDARQTVSYGELAARVGALGPALDELGVAPDARVGFLRSVELREEPLPKSGAGKLLKTVLREPFWAGLDRRVN